MFLAIPWAKRAKLRRFFLETYFSFFSSSSPLTGSYPLTGSLPLTWPGFSFGRFALSVRQVDRQERPDFFALSFKLITFLVALKLFIWSSNFCERETAPVENDRPAVPNRCQDSPKMLLTSNANFSHYRYFGFD